MKTRSFHVMKAKPQVSQSGEW